LKSPKNSGPAAGKNKRLWTGEAGSHRLPGVLNPANYKTCGTLSGTIIDRARKFIYYYRMFTLIPCAAGCGMTAITGSRLCAAHVANKENEAARIGRYISERMVVKDLNAPGLHFESVDFSHRKFYGCNFKGATFSMCLFTESFMRMVFFDFANFYNCDFSRSDLQFLSFAGAKIRDCTFEGSELLHLNYGGAKIRDCTFNKSNLYNSRFINADMEYSDFIDCNIKKVYFIRAKQEGISFKSSNTAEAVFTLGEE
jgi:uncharacterized protein YjbI with pentapeptide repeats